MDDELDDPAVLAPELNKSVNEELLPFIALSAAPPASNQTGTAAPRVAKQRVTLEYDSVNNAIWVGAC